VSGGASLHRGPAAHDGVSGRTCAHCGAPLIGRHPQAQYCSETCKRLEQLARGFQPVVLPGETIADAEHRAELAEARRQIAKLAVRAERLVLGARDDSLVRCELATIRSMIRAAEARLEQDAGEAA
jgi:hypothetical protein